MNEKKNFGDQLELFFEGKGFYIVLFLCAAVIGISSWVLLMGTNVEEIADDVRTAGVFVSPAIIETPALEEKTEAAVGVVKSEPVVLPESENVIEVWSGQTVEQPAAFVWPLNGDVITPYAVTSLMYDKTMEDWRAHGGVDIAADLGAHVQAVSAGTVTAVISDAMYGTTVIIEHDGGVESIYSNLAAQPTVYKGDRVEAGQVIGAVGNTAICESALTTHLHFSMRKDGAGTDPRNFLP